MVALDKWVVLWNEKSGRIKVVGVDSRDTALADNVGYPNSIGNCSLSWASLPKENQVILMLRTVIEVSCSTGIHPTEVHKEFMRIPDYRRVFEDGYIDEEMEKRCAAKV